MTEFCEYDEIVYTGMRRVMVFLSSMAGMFYLMDFGGIYTRIAVWVWVIATTFYILEVTRITMRIYAHRVIDEVHRSRTTLMVDIIEWDKNCEKERKN